MDSSATITERSRDEGAATSVLFVCTHNSARSQMAEALLRELGQGAFESHSAGTRPGRLHPFAARVMAEAGLDISHQEAKGLEAFEGARFDYVITVCDQAKEACPFFAGAKRRLHWSLPDPSAVGGDEEQRLAAFRQVRDELSSLITEFISGVKPWPRARL